MQVDCEPEPDPEFATSNPDPYPDPDPEAAADPLPEPDPLPESDPLPLPDPELVLDSRRFRLGGLTCIFSYIFHSLASEEAGALTLAVWI